MRKGVMSVAQALSLAALLVGLPVALYLVLNAVRVWPKAAVTDPHLFFAPAEASLPPNQTLELKIDAKGNQIGFVDVEFTFDKTKVNLAGEITTTSVLGTVVQKTTMAQANATGRANVVLALDTDATAPTGVASLASIPFTVITSAQNQTATIAFDVTGMEVSKIPPEEILFTTSNATLTVNPTDGPTNTPTPTGALTPSPTPTGVITPSPTPTGGPSPTPTIDPTKTQLTIKIRLQGITVLANDQLLRFTFVQNGVVKVTYQNVLATAGVDGVYKATVPNIVPGTYDIYVKSRSHLQRKFPLVTLDPGVVVLDLTKNISF